MQCDSFNTGLTESALEQPETANSHVCTTAATWRTSGHMKAAMLWPSGQVHQLDYLIRAIKSLHRCLNLPIAGLYYNCCWHVCWHVTDY